MARTREPFDQDEPEQQQPVSSDELLKRAWESIGMAESGQRSARRTSSASGAMTSSANVSSTASSVERALAAEEIARLLREEELRSRASTRQAQPTRPPRPTAADAPPPRPRRTQPIEVPPSQQPPPPQLPPPRVPSREAPEPALPAPARRAGRPGWLVFAAVAAILSIVGNFTENVQTEPADDVPDTVPATTEPRSLGDSTPMSVAALEPGLCIVWLPPGESAAVDTVPCTEAHQYEVFAVVDIAPASAEYTGPEEIYDLGFEACFAEFSDYVGEDYADSPWHISLIPPTEAQWVEGGDRAAPCLLYQPGPEGGVYTEGTARGSGRGRDST